MTPLHDLTCFTSQNWRKGKQGDLGKQRLIQQQKEKTAARTECGRLRYEPELSCETQRDPSNPVRKHLRKCQEPPADERCYEETWSRSITSLVRFKTDSCSGISTVARSPHTGT